MNEPSNLFLISMQCLIAVLYLLLYLMNKQQKQRNKEYERLKQRNETLPMFRHKVLCVYGEQAFDQLKSYNDMLYSKKELIVSEWVDPDKAFNLN